MFGKKIQKSTEAVEPLNLPSSQDLIVHNMPSPSRLGGGSLNSSRTDTGDAGIVFPSQKQNFKIIGLVIIGGGVIFIGGLVYLSYHFVISPTIGSNKTIVSQPVPAETKKIATVTPAVVTTPISPVASVIISTSTVNDTSSSSPTGPLMNEELSGQDGSNLSPLLDSDNDGLFDEEETLLSTSATSTNSDGDKYTDLVEINSGYDPAGQGKLTGNPSLAVYDNQTYNYSVIYPKNWTLASEHGSLGAEYTAFTAPDDSLIQISVQDNPDKAGILSWYENWFPGVVVAYDQLISIDGWDGIMGPDNLNFYLTDSQHKNIYVFSYIPAFTGRIVYPNIFKLMINSLVIK